MKTAARTVSYALALVCLATSACGWLPKKGGNTDGEVTTPVDPNAVDENGPPLRFVGRFDFSQGADQPVMAWPGSSVLTRFSGTSLTVNIKETVHATYNGLSTDSYYNLYIDEQNPVVIPLKFAQNSYPVVKNLENKVHTVRLTKRTEAQLGVDQFLGFSTDGKLLAAPKAATRRIEIIGDSISAGYGVLGEPCGAVNKSQNADLTYGALVAKRFAADYTDVAFSGKGLLRNADFTNDPVNTMPVLYNYIDPLSNKQWDFTQWTPDAVVINLGSNDWHADGAALDVQAFTQKYIQFVATVRAHYPKAAIFCAVSPSLHGSDLDQAVPAIKQVVAASGANVIYFAFDEDLGKNGQGCDGHPSQTTQQVMAQKLITSFQANLRWE